MGGTLTGKQHKAAGMNEDTRLVFLIGRTGRTGGILDHFHNLFDDLRMQDRVAMKRNCHPEIVFSVYTVATFGSKMLKPCAEECVLASPAIQRGSLCIHFDGGSQDLTAEKQVAVADLQRLEIKLNRLLDIGNRFLQRVSLRLAASQFRAPSVESILVFLDHDACFPHHTFRLR